MSKCVLCNERRARHDMHLCQECWESGVLWTKLICDCCGRREAVRGFLIGHPRPTFSIKLCFDCHAISGFVWDEGVRLIEVPDEEIK